MPASSAKYHLISTFDYEVFGDGSGCLQHCVVRPMEQALEISENFQAPQTLFVDMLEFSSFKKLHNTNTTNRHLANHYEKVEQQICQAQTRGHAIQLHLHPQWLEAQAKADSWELDFSKWRIGDLDRQTIDNCLQEAFHYVKSLNLCESSQQHYTCKVFRAGGWAIQPEKVVIEALTAQQVSMDSTVAPGIANPSKGDWFDFKAAMQHKPYWRASDNLCHEDPDGPILEVPIATYSIGRRAHLKILKESKAQAPFPDQCVGSYQDPNTRWQKIQGKLSKLVNIGTIMLDLSTMPAWALIEATRGYMKRFATTAGPIPIVTIGHNKNFTTWSASNTNTYFEWLQKQDDIQFSDYHRWYDALKQFRTNP